MKTTRCRCGGTGLLSAVRVHPDGHEEVYFCLKCGGRFTAPAPAPAPEKGVA